MKITGSLNEDAVMIELGRRIERLRIDRELTQNELAEQAGIGKRTLERLENGYQVQTSSLIRTLRCLGRLEALDTVVPEAGTRPIEMLKLQGKSRKRVSKARGTKNTMRTWTWGDET